MPDRNPGDTRTRIQDVALELFTEHGYDKTSLREIAERLGITKASLYYYFNSKDAIVQSLVDDLLGAVDELVEWAAVTPSTPHTRRELLERYGKVIRSQPPRLLRFLMENQPAMREHEAGEALHRRLQILSDYLVDLNDPLHVQMCCRMALFALHGGPVIMRDVHASSEEIYDASCDVARSLLPPD